jgi:hypothetical protein
MVKVEISDQTQSGRMIDTIQPFIHILTDTITLTSLSKNTKISLEVHLELLKQKKWSITN